MVVDFAAARQARQDAIVKARIDELWELLKRWVHEGEDEDIARTLSSGAWLLENLLQEFYPHHRRRRDVSGVNGSDRPRRRARNSRLLTEVRGFGGRVAPSRTL